jgi:putative transposase
MRGTKYNGIEMREPGQLLTHEEQEPNLTPAIPGERINEIPHTNTRTNNIKLILKEKRLKKLANACAKLWNELTYERRQQYFNSKHVDLKGTANKYYEKYKKILGSTNAQAVIRKNNEAWHSFFELLKKKKEGKLPKHIHHISPPGYWKDRKANKRKLILIVRNDRYEVRERTLYLKDWNIEIPFTGKLKWYGKQGRLEIIYDEAKRAWYAHIPVDVGTENTKTGKPSKHIVHGERKRIQIAEPKGNKKAAVDLGINILASVVVDDGTWLLYKGVRAKEDYFYFEKRIAEAQSLADNAKNAGRLGEFKRWNRVKGRLYRKLSMRLLHLYRNLANHLVKRLWGLGVSELYLGYPFNIAQDAGNKFTVNLWSYRKLMDIIELKAQEYGIRVFEVVEYNTSRFCAFHGVEVVREERGVVVCPFNHKLHADLNGALNILRIGAGVVLSNVGRPLSFVVGHDRVASVKGGNPRDSRGNSVPLEDGVGS